MKTTHFEGSCQCGAVAYVSKAPNPDMVGDLSVSMYRTLNA